MEALAAVALVGMDCMGGDEPADLHADNMSWFLREDLINATSMNDMTCRAIMGALQRKGLAVDSGEGVNGKGPNQWYLSEAGINAAQHLWANIDQVKPEDIGCKALSRFLSLRGF